jgi:hypothetical protein
LESTSGRQAAVKLTQKQRKLIGLLICLIVVVVRPLLGRELTEVEGWVVGTLYTAFVGGNVGEHLSSAIQARAGAIAEVESGGDEDEGN